MELPERLPEKAEQLGYFDMQDLSAIAEWGGTSHGVKQRLRSSKTPHEVRRDTERVYRVQGTSGSPGLRGGPAALARLLVVVRSLFESPDPP